MPRSPSGRLDVVADRAVIDVVIDQAHRQHVAPVEEFPPEMFERIIAVMDRPVPADPARPGGPVQGRRTRGRARGVTSNCICPAYVRTPLVENQIAAQAERHGSQRTRSWSRSC
ncbi:hypothetical protein BH23ACT9_BH23ACT9_24580 [soil metagenome]